MDKYRLTIGLEVHAELNTRTKMFCACKNDGEEKRPNWNVCPICMGHPGTLPVPNKEAIRHVLKVGLALGGKLATKTEFDRKNYFYPDIPKDYQISQHKHPFVKGGELAGVAITRVHLEEDTAKSSHDKGDFSLVDYNRAGVPLMELVTEPVMHSSEEVLAFGKELQLLLQYLGVSHANMEKGEMRLEANVSISDTDKLGTKVEIKNLNSFKAAKDAIDYEFKRHIEALESGGKIAQETRGWNEARGETFSQRSKEDSHDYRYFGDPDLSKMDLELLKEFEEEALRSEMKETPNHKRERFVSNFGLKEADVEFYISNRPYADLFESSAKGLPTPEAYKILSNYIVSDIAGMGEQGLGITPALLSELVTLIIEGKVSSRGAKNILSLMAESGESPEVIATREGLFQKNDESAIRAIIDEVIKANPLVVEEYKAGKESSIQFLIGQGMRLSKGSANPGLLKQMLEKALK